MKLLSSYKFVCLLLNCHRISLHLLITVIPDNLSELFLIFLVYIVIFLLEIISSLEIVIVRGEIR